VENIEEVTLCAEIYVCICVCVCVYIFVYVYIYNIWLRKIGINQTIR